MFGYHRWLLRIIFMISYNITVLLWWIKFHTDFVNYFIELNSWINYIFTNLSNQYNQFKLIVLTKIYRGNYLYHKNQIKNGRDMFRESCRVTLLHSYTCHIIKTHQLARMNTVPHVALHSFRYITIIAGYKIIECILWIWRELWYLIPIPDMTLGIRRESSLQIVNVVKPTLCLYWNWIFTCVVKSSVPVLYRFVLSDLIDTIRIILTDTFDIDRVFVKSGKYMFNDIHIQLYTHSASIFKREF